MDERGLSALTDREKENRMDNSLRVTLVANAALLLEYKGTTLLLDGIYGGEGLPFSPLPAQVRQQMKAGQAPFDKVDFLLFTHAHPDHFSPEMTLEYVQNRPVKGVFAPDTPAVTESGLPEFLARRGIPCALLSDRTNHTGVRITPEITVRAFRTLHLDKKFENVEHFCYLITFGDKNILFTADIDYVTEDLARLRGIRLDAAFINPLFFGALRRGRFFRGKLDANRILVYHVPFAEDDTMGMRAILEQDMAAWPKERAWVTALTEPFQTLRL